MIGRLRALRELRSVVHIESLAGGFSNRRWQKITLPGQPGVRDDHGSTSSA